MLALFFMDVSGGLFALGGVALAAAFSEMRAWREARERRTSSIYELRRTTYALAQRQVEDVAAAIAKWTNESAPADDAWTALTVALATKNEVSLIAGSPDVGQAMSTVLRVFRDALLAGTPALPKPSEERRALLEAFRRDLGLPN
ncbi:hypothetical protein AB0E69_05665 [Kribbella sp. NPDC026611]|uniref:hypothetical protein n=1 Tax=Kribbella sp. NPDC026611 TaxID=3154911 RepID=UPI0033F5C422